MRKAGLYLFLGLLVWFVGVGRVSAETPANSATLTPAATATVNHDDAASSDANLHFTIAYLPDDTVQLPNSTLHCPIVTQQVLLKFDVASVPFSIDKARLILNSAVMPDALPALTLSASVDAWQADTVTWPTRPLAHAGLGGTVQTQPDGKLVWQDDGLDSDNTLAEWLEYRRNADGTVTLLLDLPTNRSCWPYAPMEAGSTVVLFDAGSDFGPVLEMVSAETSFTADPLAVTLQSTTATTVPRTLLLVVVLVAFGTLFIVYMDD